RRVLGFHDDTIPNRADRSPCGRGEIRSEMGFPALLNRMETGFGVTRTDPGILDRVFQQGLAKALAVFIKIVHSFALIERKRIIRLSEVFEVNGIDATNSDAFSFYQALFVNKLEFIAALQTFKVDLPTEDIDEPVSKLGRHAERMHAGREAGVNDATYRFL